MKKNSELFEELLFLFYQLLADKVWSESSFAKVQSGEDIHVTYPSKELNEGIMAAAKKLNINVRQGTIHSSDVFYRENFKEFEKIYVEHGALAVEMESFALFHNAKVTGKNAACLLTVSDSLVTHEATTAEERQFAFTKMMDVALEMA